MHHDYYNFENITKRDFMPVTVRLSISHLIKHKKLH
jgi:hypothetical protein